RFESEMSNVVTGTSDTKPPAHTTKPTKRTQDRWRCSDSHLEPPVIIINQNLSRRTVAPKGLTMHLYAVSQSARNEKRNRLIERPFLECQPPSASRTTSRAHLLVFPLE